MKHFNPRNEYYSKKIDDRVRAQYLNDKYVQKRWLATDEDFEQIKQEISSQFSAVSTHSSYSTAAKTTVFEFLLVIH